MITWRARAYKPCEAASSAVYLTNQAKSGTRRSPGVVSGGDQEQRCGVGADAVQGEQSGGVPGQQGHDEVVQARELAVQELRAPSQLAQRDPGVVADDRAGPGPQGRQVGDP